MLENFITIALVVLFSFTSNSQNKDLVYSKDRFRSEQYLMAQKAPQQAYAYFNEGASYFKEKNDIPNYLLSINFLADIEHRRGHFNKAFDLIWDALPLADSIDNKKPLYKFHQMLGILYSAFGKDSIALTHTKKGLEIAKTYYGSIEQTPNAVISSYLDVAVQLTEMKAYEPAINYLDSCYIAHNKSNRLYFVDGVYGIAHLKQGNYKKAKSYFDGVLEYLEHKNNGFQTSIAFHLGELQQALNNHDSVIYYFNKSLKAIDSLEYNIKLKPKVLEALSNQYFQTNEYLKAYNFMQKAKAISDSLFHAQSELNKNLFEIKNRYKEDLNKKQTQLKIQSKTLLANQRASFRLKLLIAAIALFILITFIAIKQQNKIKQMAFKREKNKAILELKNKELTANALQIIEKETTVNELLKTLKVEDPKKFKPLYKRHKQSIKRIWDDFHLRFTEINNSFYNNLQKHHPDLTITDLKHCALIKLNFNSKEMSQILGISINSVHMARSRIRKKLNLNRNESLGKYIRTF